MSALSPPSVSTIGLYFDHTISPDQNCLQGSDLETLESALHFPTYLAEFELDPVTPPLAISCDPKMVKKLNHNASERNRRQKMNDLYSSLGSLLPEADRTVTIRSFSSFSSSRSFRFYICSLGWRRQRRWGF